MKKFFFSTAVLLSFLLLRCGNGNVNESAAFSIDTAVIAAGKTYFYKHCAACHDFNQDGIGPSLGGITKEAPIEWLHQFIRDPQTVIASGDKRADSLFKKYKSVMPSFVALPDEELDAVLAFLNTEQGKPAITRQTNGQEIRDPFPEKIEFDGVTVNLKPFSQFPASAATGNFPKTRITKLTFEPASGDLFVNDLRGTLYKIKKGRPKEYLDIRKLKPKFIAEPGLATGFGSFAFHPEFSKNGLLYTTHTESPGSGKSDFVYNDSIKTEVQWVLTEWKADDVAADLLTGHNRELLRINMVAGAHGVQEITFNPLAKPGGKDYGLLYIGIGDGASVQLGYPFVTHGKDKIWGTIIRIDPAGSNSSNGQYGIPADNPFYFEKDKKTVREIYAYGFRNPHRITWTKNGEMLASNIGQANIEAIDLIKPGHDYGWPIREGSFAFDPYGDLNKIYPLPADDTALNITYPIAQFDHDEGVAVSGGYEYWGKDVPVLNDKFLFGDIPSGRLFYIETPDIKKGGPVTIKEFKITINDIPGTLKAVCGSNRVDLHFGRDREGELYILTKSDGKVYKIVDAHRISKQ